MTHNMAALFGHSDETLVAWQQACVHAADTLQPPPDPERLAKALALAQNGAVTLTDDGSATMQGRSGQPYTVRGTQCDCPDAMKHGQPCKHLLAVQIHQQATAQLAPSANATPQPAQPAASSKRQARPRSSAAWDVHEAPVSSCFKIRVGTLEWTHTIRGSDDAELQTRLQAFLPTFRAIAAALEAMQAEREAAKAAAAPPAAQAIGAPADLQALIQQAVQQALAAHAPSHGTPPANGTAPSTPPPAPPSTGTAAHSTTPGTQAPASQDHDPAATNETPFYHAHQAPLELRRNARSSWWSHWLASEKRYCKGA